VLAAALLAVGTPIVVLGGNVAAVEVTAARFVTSARVDRPQATVGQSVAVTASVKSERARRALIDLEIYDQAGRKVFQQFWNSQSFTAGQTRTFTAAWATGGLAAGSYSVKVGVFAVDWRSMIHWNDRAADVALVTSARAGTSPHVSTPFPGVSTR